MAQPQSKLSEALAATLLRFKEIDRDTIESLSKRAATLEHQVTQNNADINRETALRQMAQERGEEVTKLKAELSAWHTAEKQLSNAYIRLRRIVGALGEISNHTVVTSEDIWRFTEAKASALVKSHTQLQWALRNLLAHTRDVNDRHNGEGEGWQSDELEEAIKQADALVGLDATDAFPIADDVLYRRIEELELALAAAKAPKPTGGFVTKTVAENLVALSGKAAPDNIAQSPLHRIMLPRDTSEPMPDKTAWILKDKDGEVKVQVGHLGPDAVNTNPQLWSEKELLDLIRRYLSDLQSGLAESYSATQRHLAEALAETFKQVQADLVKAPQDMDIKAVVTVTAGDKNIEALIKRIIGKEMRPGGDIHKALIGR